MASNFIFSAELKEAIRKSGELVDRINRAGEIKSAGDARDFKAIERMIFEQHQIFQTYPHLYTAKYLAQGLSNALYDYIKLDMEKEIKLNLQFYETLYKWEFKDVIVSFYMMSLGAEVFRRARKRRFSDASRLLEKMKSIFNKFNFIQDVVEQYGGAIANLAVQECKVYDLKQVEKRLEILLELNTKYPMYWLNSGVLGAISASIALFGKARNFKKIEILMARAKKIFEERANIIPSPFFEVKFGRKILEQTFIEEMAGAYYNANKYYGKEGNFIEMEKNLEELERLLDINETNSIIDRVSLAFGNTGLDYTYYKKYDKLEGIFDKLEQLAERYPRKGFEIEAINLCNFTKDFDMKERSMEQTKKNIKRIIRYLELWPYNEIICDIDRWADQVTPSLEEIDDEQIASQWTKALKEMKSTISSKQIQCKDYYDFDKRGEGMSVAFINLSNTESKD
ncbi:MAG: hypothetical protein GPJ51_12475 [Candidatus Heimdallarchaeota archaeon]|nr:hypothetical protein [Candidatus Heimdallarchaeota archaeon]